MTINESLYPIRNQVDHFYPKELIYSCQYTPGFITRHPADSARTQKRITGLSVYRDQPGIYSGNRPATLPGHDKCIFDADEPDITNALLGFDGKDHPFL